MATCKAEPQRLRLALGLTLAALLLLASPAGADQAVSGPPIRSGSEVDYPPFCSLDAEGQADGFSVELLRAAARAMGREVSFPTGTWATVRGWLEKGEVDALPLVGRTPEREALFDFSIPYLSLHGALVVREDERGIQTLADLDGRRVGVLKGDNAEEFLRREKRGFAIVTTPTYSDALRQLSEGLNDAVLIPRLVALRLAQQSGLAGLRISRQAVEGFRQDFCFAVREGDRELLALLNEGMALVMADGTFRRLHAKWFAALELPARHLVVGGDAYFPPYEFLDEKGHPAGFNVDITRAIARETGLDLEIRLGNFAELRQQLARSEIDAMQGMIYSAERARTFDFSPPHEIVQSIAVVRRGSMPAPNLASELAGRRLVVQRGDRLHDFALENGLTSLLTVVESQDYALRAVLEGQQDCALVSRLPALYWRERNGWTNLEFARTALLSEDYGYAVPKGQKALLAQLSEGLKRIEASGEYRRIQDKWMGVYKEDPSGWRTALRYLGWLVVLLLLVLGAAMAWSWTLRNQVAVRTAELKASESKLRVLVEEAGQARAALMGIVQDQQRTERELKHASMRFKALIENAPDGIVLVEAGGKMVFASPEARKMFGYGPEDSLIASPQDHTHPDDVPAVMAALEQLFRNPSEVLTRQYRFRHMNGSWVWVESIFSNLLAVPGVEAICINFRNITDRKQAEGERDRLRDQLLQAQKMESVGRLAGGVAHDFNNMLQAILGHVELLMMKCAAQPDLLRDLEEIRKAAHRSATLTAQLLAFARKQTVNARVLDLNLAVAGMLKMLHRLLGEDIELVWKPCSGRAMVKMDPSQLDQILANLTVNARDALAGAGQLFVETALVTVAAAGARPAPELAPGSYVQLKVRDTGCGIAAEIREKIFEPFFTTKPMGKGTGLGLPTVYGIVRQNGGDLTVESEPGQGSTFTVYLPRLESSVEPLSVEPELAELPHGNETVMLVEDEPSIRVTLRRFLDSLGYAVLVAQGPGEALFLCANHPGRIDLLVTDVIMPGMSGRDLAQQLLATRPQLKCLYISGYTADIIAARGILEKDVALLHKPFSRASLAVKVREVLGADATPAPLSPG